MLKFFSLSSTFHKHNRIKLFYTMVVVSLPPDQLSDCQVRKDKIHFTSALLFLFFWLKKQVKLQTSYHAFTNAFQVSGTLEMAFQRTKQENKHWGVDDVGAPQKFSAAALAIHTNGVEILKLHKPSFQRFLDPLLRN